MAALEKRILTDSKRIVIKVGSALIRSDENDLINEHPNEVQAFKKGKIKLLGFFVGQLMKRTKGKADPKLANKLLMEKLNS